MLLTNFTAEGVKWTCVRNNLVPCENVILLESLLISFWEDTVGALELYTFHYIVILRVSNSEDLI